MRLRYYMRGLGIGILVTALIMGVAGGKQIPLTDAEIKAKAAQLGMVESGSITLSDVQQIQNTNQTSVPEQEGVEEPAEGVESTMHEEAGSESPENENPENENPENESSENESSENESPENESSENESTEKQPESESETAMSSNTESEVKSITVKAGSGSETVCKQLAEAGIIEDAGEYDKYLMKNGYATRICVGTYEIQPGSSWEEIAKIITRKK